MKQNADLLDRLQELIGQIHIHQIQHNVQPAQPESRAPSFVSEDEDDLMFAYRHGDIDRRELEERLQELGFDNASIEVDFAA